MPLVKVGIIHGTEGLRKRLHVNLEKAHLEKSELIQSSVKLGTELHVRNRRTYEPYNNHLLRVAIRLIEQAGITDEQMIAAAPLHDSLEDHSGELVQRYLGMAAPLDPEDRRLYGYEALRLFAEEHGAEDLPSIVWDVSTPLRPAGASKIQWYLSYIGKLMDSSHPKSRVVKHADFLDNVDAPIDREDPKKRAYLDRKQLGAYVLHLQALEKSDSAITGEAREAVIELLKQRYADAQNRIASQGKSKITLASNSLRTA